MDGRTDRPTERPSYRDAMTHLKCGTNFIIHSIIHLFIHSFIHSYIFSFIHLVNQTIKNNIHQWKTIIHTLLFSEAHILGIFIHSFIQSIKQLRIMFINENDHSYVAIQRGTHMDGCTQVWNGRDWGWPVAQGQYVVSGTRCPALHGSESEWEEVGGL